MRKNRPWNAGLSETIISGCRPTSVILRFKLAVCFLLNLLMSCRWVFLLALNMRKFASYIARLHPPLLLGFDCFQCCNVAIKPIGTVEPTKHPTKTCFHYQGLFLFSCPLPIHLPNRRYLKPLYKPYARRVWMFKACLGQ